MSKTKKYGTEWSVEGAGWVYRRPFLEDGKWRARRRHVASGRVERLSLEADNMSDAKTELERRAAAERSAAEAGGPAAEKARAATVGAALAEWYQFIEKTQEFRGATLQDYRNCAKQYEEALGKDGLLAEIGYTDIEKLLTGRWADRAARTKCGHLDRLGVFFEWAKRNGYTRRNPAKEFPRPKAWQKERLAATEETGQALTLAEMRSLLKACRETFLVDFRPDLHAEEKIPREKLTERRPPDHLHSFVFLSLRTGLRVSNIMGSKYKDPLRWRNIDLERGILSLPGEMMKTGKALRVPLHREAIEFLKKLRGARVPGPEEPVVGPIRELKNSFSSALVRAKLVDPVTRHFLGELRNQDKPHVFRIHDLRHSACSLLGAVVPGYINEILSGHVASTQNSKYGRHITIEVMREELDKVPALLEEPLKKTGRKGRKAIT
jgi:integrase